VTIPLASRTRTLAELPMFMVWHQRYQQDPAHRWIRAQLESAPGSSPGPDIVRPLPESLPRAKPLVAPRQPR
jgi:hypothetical protein